jgi:predicted N-formylglutamate amidohydrolase
MTPASPVSKLLTSTDPAPVSLIGPALSPGPLVLLGDHAGRVFPRTLGEMGLAEVDRARHIALDLGIEPLGRLLSERLNAPFVSQVYSRLVVDCNRDPGAPGAIPEVSDGTSVPANRGLLPEEREERVRAIHSAYHQAIEGVLDARAQAGLPTILVALHSFTPVFGGERRVWDAGVLHGGPGDAYGRRVLALLRARGDWVIGDNEPYAFDRTDYTIWRHAFPRGLPWLELELRQDRLASAGQQEEVAGWLAPLLLQAAEGR